MKICYRKCLFRLWRTLTRRPHRALSLAHTQLFCSYLFGFKVTIPAALPKQPQSFAPRCRRSVPMCTHQQGCCPATQALCYEDTGCCGELSELEKKQENNNRLRLPVGFLCNTLDRGGWRGCRSPRVVLPSCFQRLGLFWSCAGSVQEGSSHWVCLRWSVGEYVGGNSEETSCLAL